MKNKELFNKTVAILVKAFQDDVLEYTDCSKCAVGNLIKGNGGDEHCSWANVIRLGSGELHTNRFHPRKALTEMAKTGYTPIELAKIEREFLLGIGDEFEPDDNFNGLMKVVDYLMTIHEATTEEATEAKQLFVKA